MSKKIVLIDGHSILNRAFFGIPDLTNSEGLHTNAVYGFLNILFKILDEEKPDYLTVAFDRSEPTFRHKMYDAYKGTRKPMAEELRQQVPVMKDVLHAMGIVTVEKPGYEADDILGTIAGRAEADGMEVSIISGDRDLLQLATDKVKIRIPKTKKSGTEIEDYNTKDVVERYQVTPKEFIDVKALMGDSSDNIPGVPGIGEKGATNIIVAYKSIENAYAHVDEIKPKRAQTALAEHYDMAQMSKELAAIDTNADIDYDMESALLGNLYTPEAYVYFKRLEFKQMLARFDHADSMADPIEDCFETLETLDEIDTFFAEIDVDSAAVAFLEEAGEVYGAAVAYPENAEGIWGSEAADFKSENGNVLSGNTADTDNGKTNGYSQMSLFDMLGANTGDSNKNETKEEVTKTQCKAEQVTVKMQNAEERKALQIQNMAKQETVKVRKGSEQEEAKTQEKKAESGQENAAVHVVFCKCGGEVTVSYLERKIQQLCDECQTVIAPDVKALLKHISLKTDESPEKSGADPEDAGASYVGKEAMSVMDINLAAYLLNPLKNEYSYDDIAKDYLNQMIPAKTDLLGKLKLPKAAKENPEAVSKLACFMAYTCLKSADPLRAQLRETGMERLYDEMELPLVFVLDDMEKIGVRADGDALKNYGEQLVGRIQELESSIYDRAGEEFNINSPKQLGVILFEKLQMPNGKKTKTGYSTAADVLEKLAPDYPIVSEILEYRQLTKLKSTYADGLAPCIASDGRIHSTFNQTITATGRLSSTEPNLQNIPIRMELGRLIRKVFIPKEGYVFIDADYSQIELRVLAHMSEDQNLIAAYRHAEDIHRITASQVFHTPLDEVTPLQRRNAKAVNFGIVYGISSFGLSQDLSISRKEAENYIESYFETFPGIKTYLDRVVAEAKEKGYAKTMFGRRRPVPELSSSNFMQRQFGERIAMNSPIQGTAADIIKIAMIRVYRRLKEENLKSRLILQVHDELLIETALEEAERVKEILSEEMHHAAELSVELEVDMNEGSNWFEAH